MNFGFMYTILLLSVRQHVSATYVTIFRVVRPKIRGPGSVVRIATG